MVDPIQDQDVVILDRRDNTTLVINLLGATITSWRYNNREQLFVSRHCNFDKRIPINGGISFTFPVIGDWRFGPPNGFARVMRWKVERAPFMIRNTFDIRTVLVLQDDAYSRSFLNFQFKIIYIITLMEKEVNLNIKIENSSTTKTLRFMVEFPIFLRVPDLNVAHINGLTKCQFRDQTQGAALCTDYKKTLLVKEWTHKLYLNTPNEVSIDNTVNGYKIKVQKRMLPDLIIRHPGENLTDLNTIQMNPGFVQDEFCLQPEEQTEFEINLEIWKEPIFQILPW